MEANKPLIPTERCSTSYFKSHLKCDRCFKELPTRGSLNRHIKTHTRPYVCKHCGKGFSLSRDLERHGTQHRTLAILFHCHVPACEVKGFPRKDNLRRHIRTHHANVLQQDNLQGKAMKDFCDKATLEHKQRIETSSILMAAETGNEMMLYSIVNNYGSNLDMKSADGKTALHIAVAKGNQQCVCILLNAGADLEALDFRGDTALHYAAYVGNLELLELLCERKADFSKRNHESHTVLHICARKGHVLAAKFLLHMGFAVDSTTVDKKTALHLAIVQSDESMVEVLLDNGAYINANGHRNITPLFLAVAGGHECLAKLLLERGADLHTQSLGIFPLRRAMLNDREDMMELLVQYGADVGEASLCHASRLGIYDRKLLFRAVGLKKQFFLRLLLQLGADPNTRNFFGRNLLNHAVWEGKLASIRLLLEYGANVNEVRWNPIKTALSIRHRYIRLSDELMNSIPAIIKLLLDHGADTKCLSQEENEFIRRCNSELPGGGASL